MNYIKRPKYFEKIKPFCNKYGLVKVILGQRRVGKSMFLYEIMEYIRSYSPNDALIYINKEKIERDHIKDYKDLHEAIKNYKYIFIDEIQYIEKREKAIIDLQSEEEHDIYITGSNSNLLSGELSTLLSGTYVEVTMYPLDYKEFTVFHNISSGPDSFLKYIEYGGLPYLKNIGLNENSNEYLQNVFETIIFKDVVKRYSIRNIDFYMKLIHYLGKNIGTIFSAKAISDYLISQKVKLSTNLVLDYIYYSLSALFINKVKRYDIKGKKIFELKEKYYRTDIGLRNCIHGFKDLDIGQILENIVFSNLISNGREVFVGELPNNKEIDFIASKNNKKMYIQVSYKLQDKKTIEREFENFTKITDNRPKFVIVYDKIGQNFDNEGIHYLTIEEFLRNYI